MHTHVMIAAAVAALLAGPLVVSAEAAPTSPVAVTGELPAGVTSIEVLLVPSFDVINTDAPLRLLPVSGEDVSISNGTFQVAIDPQLIPPTYIQAEGVVDFQVIGRTSDRDWVSNVSARLAVPEGEQTAVWTDPVETAAAVASAPTTAAKLSGGTKALPLLMADVDEPEFEDEGVDVDTFAPSKQAQRAHCEYRFDGAESIRSATIGTSYPFGVSTARLSITENMGGSYGLAFKAPGGAWHADGSKFVRNDWEMVWNFSSAQRSYRKELLYRRYDYYCGAAVPVYLGKEWKVILETGGVGTSNTGITRPTWNTYCGSASPGQWSRTSSSGTAYSFGAGVKFASAIGIDLGVTRDYSSQQRLTYDIAGTQKKLCGSNTYPSMAGKIIERHK